MSKRRSLSLSKGACGLGAAGRRRYVVPYRMAWTYILECADGSYYVGSTRDLAHRLDQHATGHGSTYTSTRLPVRLAWAQEFASVREAWAAERKLHGWSRAKREAVIRGEWNLLPSLSRNTTERARLDKLDERGAPEPPTAP